MGMPDLTGMRFGRLTVESLSGKRLMAESGVRRVWNCKCDCGNSIMLPTSYLTRGTYRSCGCLQREISRITAIKNNTKHNCSKDFPRQYNIWKGINQRCYNSKHPEYHCYGGKGVRVCDEWKNNPRSFCLWWQSQCVNLNKSLDIDRIDPNGNYEPSNCRLLTRSENAKRKTHMWLTVKGITKTCAEWNQILSRGQGYLQRVWRRKGEDYAHRRLVDELKNKCYAQ